MRRMAAALVGLLALTPLGAGAPPRSEHGRPPKALTGPARYVDRSYSEQASPPR